MKQKIIKVLLKVALWLVCSLKDGKITSDEVKQLINELKEFNRAKK